MVLIDIVAKLARSSSESEIDNLAVVVPLIEHELEIDFREHLEAFQDTVPRHLRSKKLRLKKRKEKKERTDGKYKL